MNCVICAELKERGEDQPCVRCSSRAQGIRCASCNSQWVYGLVDGQFTKSGDDELFCKLCLYSLIKTAELDVE